MNGNDGTVVCAMDDDRSATGSHHLVTQLERAKQILGKHYVNHPEHRYDTEVEREPFLTRWHRDKRTAKPKTRGLDANP